MTLILVCCAFLLGYFTCRMLDRLGSAPTQRAVLHRNESLCGNG